MARDRRSGRVAGLGDGVVGGARASAAPRTRSGRSAAARARCAVALGGACSIAASAARSRRQPRQKSPSAELAQVSGSGSRLVRRSGWPRRRSGRRSSACGPSCASAWRRVIATPAFCASTDRGRCALVARLELASDRPRSSLVELAGEAEGAGHSAHLVGLIGEHEADPGPARAGSAGAADPVHVGVAIAGGVEVDHVGDVRRRRSRGRRRRWRSGRRRRRSRSGRARLSRWRWLLSPCIATASTSRPRRRLTSRSAPRLVRTKTSVAAALLGAQLLDQVVELGALGVDVEEAVLDVGLRSLLRRLGVAAGVAGVGGGDLAGRALQRRREEERLALAGVWATIRLTAGLKPMSSMRSASSRTRMRTAPRATTPRAIRSSSRPGVATRMSARRAAVLCGPKADAAVDGGDAQVAGLGDRAQLVDDLAGQLAGRGEDEGRGRARAPGSRRSTSGIPKASVLPEPVGDWTSRSWPASASRTTSCWTGKGCGDVAARKRAHHRFGDAEIGKRC